MKNAAVYARVSTEEQTTGMSLDAQVRAVTQKLKALKYTVPTGYIFKESASGADVNRPMLKQVLLLAQEGKIQAVGFAAPDRLARDLMHQLVLANELKKHGVARVFVSGTFEESPQGQFGFQVLGAVAELERAIIRARTTAGRDEAARQGQWPTKWHPVGFRKQDKKLVLGDPADVTLVHEVFERAARGEPLRALTRWLRTTRPQRAWSKSTIHRILTNPAYRGEAHFLRHKVSEGKMRQRPVSEQIPVPCPRIVTDELWAAVQRRLADNRARVRGGKHELLLRGHISCGLCAHHMASAPSHGVAYYRCSGRDPLNRRPCRMGLVRAVKVDAQVWDQLLGTLMRPEGMRKYLKSLEDPASQRQIRRDLKQTRTNLAYVQRKQQHLLTQLAEPGRSKDEYAFLNKELGEARDTLAQHRESEVRLKRLVQQHTDMLDRVRAGRRNVLQIASRLETPLTFEERRIIVRDWDLRATAYPKGRVTVQATPRMTADVLRVLTGKKPRISSRATGD